MYERQVNLNLSLSSNNIKNSLDLKILEEIEWYRNFVFDKYRAEKQVLREDCYNLNMNDEIFNEDAYCSNEETNFQEEQRDAI